MNNNFKYLGKVVNYPSNLDKKHIQAIPRDKELDLTKQIPNIYGADLWEAFELSWLSNKGLPKVSIAKINIPFDSSFIPESKSLKLYLNTYNQHRFESIKDVKEILLEHINYSCNSNNIKIELCDIESYYSKSTEISNAYCLDKANIELSEDFYMSSPSSAELLTVYESKSCSERLYTNIFKSNCPITLQPDFAIVSISYQGNFIEHNSLLKYLVSFRKHYDFHETCISRIFADIYNKCNPNKLKVAANFSRRGGISINPWRANFNEDIRF